MKIQLDETNVAPGGGRKNRKGRKIVGKGEIGKIRNWKELPALKYYKIMKIKR